MTRRVLAAACAAVIVMASACRRESVPIPLREDPALAKELARQQERSQRLHAARAMSLGEARALEAALDRNPEDAATRERLLVFYRWTGTNPQGWDDNVAARRRHAVWLAEHHPDGDLVRLVVLTRDADPVGYRQVRALWESHVSRPDASVAVLANAVAFFEHSELAVAERLLMRIQARQRNADDLDNYPAPERLGALYARVLAGSQGSGSGTGAIGDTAAQRQVYAREVRTKLDASRDADLLASAGTMLNAWGRGDEGIGALARQYLQRALEIDPAHGQAVYALENIQASERWREVSATERPNGAAAESAASQNRPFHLACLAERAYVNAEGQDHEGRTSAPGPARLARRDDAAALFAHARALAQEALKLAPSLPSDRPSCAPLFRANLILAAIAFREGDRTAALRHLRDASMAPPPRLGSDRRFPASVEGDLTNALLKHGERDTVAVYLERSAGWRTASDKARMLAEAAAIRDGRMPERYQRLLAAGHI